MIPAPSDPPDPWADSPCPPARGRAGVERAAALGLALALGCVGPALRHRAGGVGSSALVALGLVFAWLVASVVVQGHRGALAWRLGGLAAVVAVAPAGEHRAVLVAGVSTWLLAACLAGQRPTDQRPGEVLALPIPLVALAGLAWRHQMPVAVVVGALALAAAALAASVRQPHRARRLERAMGGAIRSVATALSALVLLLLALPLLYLPGFLHRLATAHRRRRPGSTWTVRALGPAEDRRVAHRPFAATPAPVRRHRQVVGVAWVCAGLLALLVAQHVRPERKVVAAPPAASSSTITRTPPSAAEGATTTSQFVNHSELRFSDLPAFAGMADADALQAEQQRFAGSLPPDPVTGFGSGTFHGRWTNVVDGERSTVRSNCRNCPKVRVWVVGGSVAFGLGQRDDRTVASDLVRLGDAHGLALEVHNIAVPGWTMWQEQLAVRHRLDDGSLPAPDLIVSIGGFNDVAGAATEAAVKGRDVGPHNVLDPEIVAAFAAHPNDLEGAGGVSGVAALAARRYRAAQAELIRTARDHRAATMFFFHPDAMASPTQFEPVASAVRGLPAASAPLLGNVLEQTSRELSGDVVDLRHLYDAVPQSVFADWAHTNEYGASLLAAEVYRHIDPELRSAAS